MVGIGQEYLLSVCEIKTLDNALLTMGVIGEIDETDDFIRINRKDEELMTIAYDTLVKVSVYNSKYGFKVLVGRVFLSNDNFLKIVQVTSLVDYERRAFFRIPVQIPVDLYEIEVDGEKKIPGKKILTCDMGDISLCGMFLRTDFPFTIGRKVFACFEIEEDVVMTVPCTIKRRSKLDKKDGFGCSYNSISDKHSDILYKFIFKKQSEMIRKIKEKEI